MIYILFTIFAMLLQKENTPKPTISYKIDKVIGFIKITGIESEKYRAANALINQKEYKKVIKMLLTIIEKHKDNSILKEKLAYVYFLNDQYNDARGILEKLIKIEPLQMNVYNFIYYSPDYTNGDILRWLKTIKKTKYVKHLILKYSIRNKEYSNISHFLISNSSGYSHSKEYDLFTTIITQSYYSDIALNVGKNFSLSSRFQTSNLLQNKMNTSYFEFSKSLWFSSNNSLYKIQTNIFKRESKINYLGDIEYQHQLHKWSLISLKLSREIDQSTFNSITNNEVRTKINLNGSYLFESNIFSLDTFYAQYDSQVSYSYLNTFLKRPLTLNGYHIVPYIGYTYKSFTNSFTNQIKNNFWQPKNFEEIFIGTSVYKKTALSFGVKVYIAFSQRTFNFNEWDESIYYKLEIIYTPLDMKASFASSKSTLWKSNQLSMRLHYLF